MQLDLYQVQGWLLNCVCKVKFPRTRSLKDVFFYRMFPAPKRREQLVHRSGKKKMCGSIEVSDCRKSLRRRFLSYFTLFFLIQVLPLCKTADWRHTFSPPYYYINSSDHKQCQVLSNNVFHIRTFPSISTHVSGSVTAPQFHL